MWAVQLSRKSFGMLPVLVHLLWFEMLLVKVSVMSLPQYLSRCLAFGVTFITWLVRILHCHCWVCSALCIRSGECRTGVDSYCFYKIEACDGKELARFLAGILHSPVSSFLQNTWIPLILSSSENCPVCHWTCLAAAPFGLLAWQLSGWYSCASGLGLG